MLQRVVFKGEKPPNDLLSMVRGAFYRNGYALNDSDASLMLGSLSVEDKRKVTEAASEGNDGELFLLLQNRYITLPTYHIESVKVLRPVRKVITCSVCLEEVPQGHYYLKAVTDPSREVPSQSVHICEACLERGERVSLSVDIIERVEEDKKEEVTPSSELPEDPTQLFFQQLRKCIKSVLPAFVVSTQGTTVLVGGYYELRFPAFPLERGVELWGGGIRVRSRRIRDVESALSYIKESLSPELLAKDTKKLVNAVFQSRVSNVNFGWVVQMSGLTRNRIGLLLSLPSGGEDLLSLVDMGYSSDKVDRNIPAAADSVYVAVRGLYTPDAELRLVNSLKWKGSQ